MSFFDDFLLLKATEDQESSENGLLYTYEWFLVKLLNNTMLQCRALDNAIVKCRTTKGIYNQYPDQSKLLGNDAYMSHDQLTTICSYSYKFDRYFHKEIWQEILRQKLRYNNITPESPGLRFLHPRDILYIGYLNNNWLCTLLFPLLAIIFLFTCINKYKVRPEIWNRIWFYLQTGQFCPKVKMIATDGLLLNFVRFNSCNKLGLRIVKRIGEWILKKRFGEKFWYEIIKIYFCENHPIREEAESL